MCGYIWPMSDCLGWFVVYVRVVQNYMFVECIFVTLYVHLSADMYRVFGKGCCCGHLM